MPSSASRSRGTTRRSPRPAPRAADLPVTERPLAVPFAAFFGLLVAAEDLYLAWLLWTPEVGWDWFMVGPLLLAVLAVAGSALVFTGRPRGWVVLAVAAVLPLAGLVVLAGFFALLGGAPAGRGPARLPDPGAAAARPRLDGDRTGASPVGGTADRGVLPLASRP